MNTTTQSPRCDDMSAVVEAARRAARECFDARNGRAAANNFALALHALGGEGEVY